jgi:SAM-dependent methyltransferase
MQHTSDAPIVYYCNICDRENHADLHKLTRDDPSCSKCGSSVRLRSIIQILTTELFGSSLRISEIPRSSELTGIGISCWEGYASRLARRLRYSNTFYHQEPRLDITRIDPAMKGSLDFVIATEVFEHVEPPISTAFKNTKELLKPDGVFIFSAPFTHPGGEPLPTKEHFPELHDYEIQETNGRFRLKNTTRTGAIQYFDDLVFHGGPGSTLELRLFSEWSIINEMENAGFHDITIYSGSDLRHGIYWPDRWSVPMAARICPKQI